MSTKAPTDRSPFLAMKTVMMPKDTNPHGTIFAGTLLSQLALAGIVGARHAVTTWGWPEPLLVARAVERVEFLTPANVGDVVEYRTEVREVGTTSIAVTIRAETVRHGEVKTLAEAVATYVSVEGDRPVPLRGTTEA